VVPVDPSFSAEVDRPGGSYDPARTAAKRVMRMGRLSGWKPRNSYPPGALAEYDDKRAQD
jgi:hypothetical protein